MFIPSQNDILLIAEHAQTILMREDFRFYNSIIS
jgi:hypothetical protein